MTTTGGAASSGGPTSLEILHPTGFVRSWARLGSGPGDRLAPTIPSRPKDGDDRPDVVLLSPSRSERRDPGWTEKAAGLAATVDGDGLVAVVGPSRRLLDALRSRGLEPQLRLLHAPDIERSRFVVPIPGPQARFALRSVIPLRAPKRLAARILTLPGAESLAPTSLILRPRGAAPLFGWLAELTPRRASCSMVLIRSWRAEGATVVMRFGDGSGPDVIAKVGGSPGSEADGLRAVAPGALRARIQVPRLVAESQLGGRPLLIETPVQGHPAALAVDGSSRRTAKALTALAEHLRAWEVGSAVRRPMMAADLDRDLIAPARRLAAELPGGYVEGFAARAAELVGSEVPFVAAHRDVTAANVMLASGDRIGLIDWEEAILETLPLGDLASAAVDFAAASDGYRDRVAAYRHCFEPGGRFTALTADLIAAAARGLAIGPETVRFALEACWLNHADNEHSTTTDPAVARPFMSIMRRVAARTME